MNSTIQCLYVIWTNNSRIFYYNLKLYCGYKYIRPCMINRIWGLKQLCLSDKFSCTGKFLCTPKITYLQCSGNKLLLQNFEFSHVLKEIYFEPRKIYTAHKIDQKIMKTTMKLHSNSRHIPKCSTISLRGHPDIKLLLIVVVIWTGIILQ